MKSSVGMWMNEIKMSQISNQKTLVSLTMTYCGKEMTCGIVKFN